MSKKTRISNFYRNCPKCNNLLYYSCNSSKNLATRENRLCNSCTQTGRKMSNETKIKMSLKKKDNLHPLYGKHHSDETKEKIKLAHMGKNHNTKEYKEILRKRFSGRNNPNYGKGHLISGKNNPFYGNHHTEKTKQKIRETRLKNGNHILSQCPFSL